MGKCNVEAMVTYNEKALLPGATIMGNLTELTFFLVVVVVVVVGGGIGTEPGTTKIIIQTLTLDLFFLMVCF